MTEEVDWKPYPRPFAKPVYHVAGNLLRLWMRAYGRWRVVGLENVPKTGGVLLASNHASIIDPMMIGAALYGYRPVWLMGKIDMWKSKPLGWLNDRVGGFPVRRRSADRAALKFTLEKLAAGDAVALFPEGERTLDGKLQPALPGITLLAQKGGVPIVPVACAGTFEMLPRNRKSLKRVPLTIAFGKPLVFPPGASREEVTRSVMEAIAALLTSVGQPTDPPTLEAAEPEEKARAAR